MAASHSLEAELSYAALDSNVNYRVVGDGIEYNTGRFETHRVNIRNGRLEDLSFSLDVHGFALVHRPSGVRDFFDKFQISELYPIDAAATFLNCTGATRIAPLGIVRRSSDNQPGFDPRAPIRPDFLWGQPPVCEVHVDFTPDYLESLARSTYSRVFPGAPGFTRYLVCSLWRVFSPPPHEFPLAVCDAGSVGSDEGVPNVFVNNMTELQKVAGDVRCGICVPAATIFHYNRNHRWWYFPEMTRDEVLIVKIGDSDATKAQRAPHTAFRDPCSRHANSRESIEFRAVAYFEE